MGRGELHRVLRPHDSTGTRRFAHLGVSCGRERGESHELFGGRRAGERQNIYSFDGNAGGTPGIDEMLLQSDADEIELLPACRPAGRRTDRLPRPGPWRINVDIRWRDGRLTNAGNPIAGTATSGSASRDDTWKWRSPAKRKS